MISSAPIQVGNLGNQKISLIANWICRDEVEVCVKVPAEAIAAPAWLNNCVLAFSGVA